MSVKAFAVAEFGISEILNQGAQLIGFRLAESSAWNFNFQFVINLKR